MKKNKDIGLKMATKEGAEWIAIRDAMEKRIMSSKINIKCDENILEFAKDQIAIEEAKFNK